MTLPCDVLIPAAIGGVITAENAPHLSCRIVVEAANVRPSFCFPNKRLLVSMHNTCTRLGLAINDLVLLYP